MPDINSLAALKRHLTEGTRIKTVWPSGGTERREVIHTQSNAVKFKTIGTDSESWLYFRQASDFDFYPDHFEIDSLLGGKVKYYYEEDSSDA